MEKISINKVLGCRKDFPEQSAFFHELNTLKKRGYADIESYFYIFLFERYCHDDEMIEKFKIKLSKITKNYYRKDLKEFVNKIIIVKAKFNSIKENRFVFTTVRPYVPKKDTYTLCNHLNLLKDDVLQYLDFNEFEKRKTFYMIVTVYPYNHGKRFGFKLYGGDNHSIRVNYNGILTPIWPASADIKIPNHVLEECYKIPDMYLNVAKTEKKKLK